MLTVERKHEYPRRRELSDEVHARPPESLHTPCDLSYLVRKPQRGDDAVPAIESLRNLLSEFGVEGPVAATKHFTANLDTVRLRWEAHTEYHRYTLLGDADGLTPFDRMPANVLPERWLGSLGQELLVAVHAQVIRMPDWREKLDAISAQYFAGNVLIGSRVAEGRGVALTDLRIHEDGFSRFVLINEDMTEQQVGRFVQRLFEIETYRMMALLALPVAQQLSPALDDNERELTEIGQALVDAEENQEEILLERLTRLSASSQNRHQRSSYRFDAADAYYEIVQQRISELRESRIIGLQTFEEFTARRLAPAVKTYRAVSRRQKGILEQMARATKLLSTRIDIARQRQNQRLLESMNRRVKTQLRLQATVEGLSVAAVTYYISGLVGYLAKSSVEMGLNINPVIVTGASVPLVAFVVYLGVHRLREKISVEEKE